MKRMKCIIAWLLLTALALPAHAATLLSDPQAAAGSPLPIQSITSYCTGTDGNALLDQQIWTFFQRTPGQNDQWAGQTGVDFTLQLGECSVDGLWIRNGLCMNEAGYSLYARPQIIRIALHHAGGQSQYRFLMEDRYDFSTQSAAWQNGYQRLQLPQIHANVTRIDVTLESWINGREGSEIICITDVQVTGSQGSQYPVYTPIPSQPSWQPAFTLNRPLSTRSGPSTGYNEFGTFLKAGDEIRLISRYYDSRNEIWWVQAEFTYRGVMRRAYTGAQRINGDISSLPVEQSQGSALLTRQAQPWNGPGNTYAQLGDPIPAGTQGTLWGRENGYAQFDFLDGTMGKRRRVWIEESALQQTY
ncbi:MAG: hypothetical protein IJD39_08390 [Clostridia bacterium]|nr:hypothetical protein [Clostridia bacterium]